jgi:HEAT repeat protein
MVSAVEGADVRALTDKLKSKDNEVRRAAAKELGELGAEASSAAPALSKALKDNDVFVRRFAAESLGAIGPEAKDAIPALAKAMNDSRKEVQLAVVEALGKMGPESTKALTDAVKDTAKDGAVRSKAAQGLAKIGMEARSSVPALAALLAGKMKNKKKNKGKGNDDDIRTDVAVALGSIATAEDTAAIEALKAVSEGKQKNKALKKAASDALRSISGEAPKKKKKDK